MKQRQTSFENKKTGSQQEAQLGEKQFGGEWDEQMREN